MRTTSAADRVKRGVALLDEKRPGWAVVLADMGPLTGPNMRETVSYTAQQQSQCGCVIARLEGSYWKGVGVLLEDRPGTGEDYGFNVLGMETGSVYPPTDSTEEEYDELARLWNEQVKLRTEGRAWCSTPISMPGLRGKRYGRHCTSWRQ